jgi:serine/threonine protein kinase
VSGELIGHRYRVLRKIGEGGMAVIHIAVDEKLGRDVAIKILKERFENHDEIRVRFQHEARAISAFDHPNILKIFDFSGEGSKQLWIVTELIHGRNLAQILETTPNGWLHPVIAASIVREISRALQTAHEHGVVHRDVKPENVMITHQGGVKLMDFGIAKIQRISSMTQTGMFMGSPSYMSPEQIRGKDVDHRSDVYSLGVLFYELVTGKLPYTGSSTADIAMKIIGGGFAHPRFIMAGIPEEIDRCIVKCMEILPENRPQSVDVIGSMLDSLLQHLGLENSMLELERCFKDPKAYGERLAKILRVTEYKAAPTLVLATNQPTAGLVNSSTQQDSNPVSRWNQAALNSPIPRPDISGQNLPQGSTRRDHLLPPRTIPHFTKRHQSPEMIAAHLPERRQQQRPAQTRMLPPPRPELKTPPRSIMPNTPKHMAQPPVAMVRPRVDVRPVLRSVPVAPKKVIYARKAPREQHYIRQNDQSLGALLAGVLLLVAGGILWLGTNKNANLQFRHIVNYLSTADHDRSPANSQKTKPDSAPRSRHFRDRQAEQPIRSQADQGQKTKLDKASQVIDPTNITAQRQPNNEASSQNRSSQKDQKTAITNSPRQNKPSGEDAPKLRLAPVTTGAKPMREEQTTTQTKSGTSAISQKNLPAPLQATSDNATTTTPPTIPEPASNNNLNRKQRHGESATKTQIAVTSIPAAELFINGRRQGTTNDLGTSSHWIELAPGNHRLELRRSGYAVKTETIFIEDGPRKTLGPYRLIKDDGASARPTTYRLTLATNLTPAEVTLRNIDTREVQTLTLTRSQQTITLDRGIYEVSMQHNGDIRRRRIDFSGATQQLTFGVEFKDARVNWTPEEN